MKWMFLATVGVVGCKSDGVVPVSFDVAPDFALEDRNDTSATFGEVVSPRDARGRISAWYFGHSS